MVTIDIIKIYEKIREHNRLVEESKNKSTDKKYIVIYDSHNNTLVENTILYFTKLKYELLKKVDSYTGCHIYKITDRNKIESYLEELNCLCKRGEKFSLDTINLVVTEGKYELLRYYKSRDFNLTASNYPERWNINHDMFMHGLIQFCIMFVFYNYDYDVSESNKIINNIEKNYPLILQSNIGDVWEAREYIDSLVSETLKIS